ncbi:MULTISPECIES: MFS transporter [Rhizobium/Agrobacterium group]|uniref:MFS transporter n=1 Tax=Rhizobium/Agrobacterium group TaxID=227290 RepID=UPI0008DC129B|nr:MULTISPECIES: MFS transporter [Rhizobium/Agrobacterium group]OHZ42227.1 MFS transporter permease [Agrobacterium vitis]
MEQAQISTISPFEGNTLRAYFKSLVGAPRKARMALIGCLILMVISPAGLSAMTPFVIAAFSAETHRAQADALLIFVALPLLLSPLILPLAGAWVDRWGARAVAIPAVILYAVTTAMIPLVSGTIWILTPMIILAALFGFMSSLAVIFKIITCWFPEHRGIGFALVGVLSSFANALFSPLFQWLIYGATSSDGSASGLHQLGGIGWSGSYFVVAATIAVLGIPSALFLISEPAKPSSAKRLPMPGSHLNMENAAGIPLKMAIRTKTWIFITLFLAITAAGPMTVRQNSVDFFQQRGFDLNDIAFSQSVLFVASVVGLFLGGMILDRSRRPWVIAPLLAMVPIGLTIAYFNHGSVFLLYVAMSSLGFATGAESALGPFLVARYFGPKAFAQIQGLTLAICSLSFGLTPFLTSAMATAAGSYFVPFAILTGLTMVAVALGALLPNYPPEWPTGAEVSGK